MSFLLFTFYFLLFFAYPLALDLRYGYLLSQIDTRLEAKAWIEENISPGVKILADLPYLRLTNTKEGIGELSTLDPEGLRAQDRVLLRRDEARYPTPAYHVLNLHFLRPAVAERIASDPEALLGRGFRYVVVEYEYADQRDFALHTRELLRGRRLIKRFTPFEGAGFDRALDLSGEIATIWPLELFRLERFGQVVELYEL